MSLGRYRRLARRIRATWVRHGGGLMATISVRFPEAPANNDIDDMFSALGRLVVAWSASEFHLSQICLRLMAYLDLGDVESVRLAANGKPTSVKADTNAVLAMFLSVESSRGRREMTARLADIRCGEGYITEEWHRKIKDLMTRHQRLGKRRNRLIHTPISRDDEGRFHFLDENILLGREDRTGPNRSAVNRLNNNRVRRSDIDTLIDDVRSWNSDANDLANSIQSAPFPGRRSSLRQSQGTN